MHHLDIIDYFIVNLAQYVVQRFKVSYEGYMERFRVKFTITVIMSSRKFHRKVRQNFSTIIF